MFLFCFVCVIFISIIIIRKQNRNHRVCYHFGIYYTNVVRIRVEKRDLNECMYVEDLKIEESTSLRWG